MRIKIVFLTVLAIHAIVLGTYGLIKFIIWEGMWFLHWCGLKHVCPNDDIVLGICDFLFQLLLLACAAGVSWLLKEAVLVVYEKIDKLFPEKKS